MDSWIVLLYFAHLCQLVGRHVNLHVTASENMLVRGKVCEFTLFSSSASENIGTPAIHEQMNEDDALNICPSWV